MKFEEFKQIYEKVKEKHSLPPLEKIDKNIELRKIIKKFKCKEEEDLLKFLVKKYCEQLKKFKDYLEDVLNPDLGDLATMHEMKSLEVDYNRLWKRYKQVVKILRMKQLLDIDFDENLASEIIKESERVFNDVKNAIKEILKKKIEFWQKDIKYRGFKEYLG